MSDNIPFEGLLIDGQRVASADGKTSDVYNPANGEVIAHVAQATKEDADRAVRVAHQRFTEGAWRKMNSRDRGRLLMRIADLMRENLMRFRQLESRNGGKPISATSWELESVANTFEYYAGAVNMEREIVDMMGLHFKGIVGGMLLEPGKGIVTPLRKPPKPSAAPAPAAAREAAPANAVPAPTEVKP